MDNNLLQSGTQSEIRQFEMSFRVEKKIIRLDITEENKWISFLNCHPVSPRE